MSLASCYIERTGAGASIRRVRLVAPGLDRSWSPPSAGKSGAGTDGAGGPGGVDGAGPDGQAVREVMLAAAWVAETLAALETRELRSLCIDTDGAVCTWLSAPSPDPRVISATIAQASLAGVDAASGAAARLAVFQSDPASAQSELSVQALAVPVAVQGAGGGSRRWGGKSGPPGRPGGVNGTSKGAGVAVTGGGRYALLTVPDAAVRVFLDELDARAISVGNVGSLWHALAREFDPAARADASDGESGDGEQIIAGQDIACAVLMIDPLGRLIWAWSRGGALVAGGSMRLRTVAIARPEPDAVGVANIAGSARRIAPGDGSNVPGGTAGAGTAGVAGGGGAGGGAAYDQVLECSSAEIGRLSLDWLAWAAQLGTTPQRVVCFGPQTVANHQELTQGPAREAVAPGPSIASMLATAWPGAVVDVVETDDPVGLVLSRMSAVPRIGPDGARTGDRAATSANDGTPDPRRSLASLTTRAGRADRAMYRWAAGAIAASAVAVGVLGYQLHASAGAAAGAEEAARKDRDDVLKSVEAQIPNLSRSTDPIAALRTQLAAARKLEETLKPGRPVAQETVRLLTAYGNVLAKLDEEKRAGLKITELSMSQLSPSFKLQVPDAETGPNIELAITALPGEMRWTGRAPGGGGAGTVRTYVITGRPDPSRNPKP